MKHLRIIGTSRRSFLITGIALFVSQTGVAIAGEGGDRGGDISSKPRKLPPIKKQYSQSEFVRLSQRELDNIWNKSNRGANLPQLGGFSSYMTIIIFALAVASRRRAQRLVKDMRKLKSKKSRVARLKKEAARANLEVRDLEKAYQRARKKKLKAAVDETYERLRTAKTYLRDVEKWQRHPMEGIQ